MRLEGDHSRVSLLSVGTDAAFGRSVEAFLEERDAPTEALAVDTAEAALDVVDGTALSGVVARHDLPDGDGISLLARCLERQPELVTVLLAADPSRSLVERAYDTGVDEVVPATGAGAFAVVEHHVDGYLGLDETPAGTPRTTRHMETLAATTSDAIVSIDESSVIRYANPAVADVFGYDPSTLVGEPLTTLMPDDLVGQHREGMARYMDTGERTLDWSDVELRGERADGAAIPLSISFSEFTVGGDRYFTGVMRDQTERRRLRAERELYHETTQRILEADSFEQGLRIALSAVGEALDWQYGEAWIDGGDGTLERVSGSYAQGGSGDHFEAADAPVTLERGEGLVGRVWASAEAEWIRDVTAAEAPFERQAAADRAGVHAALAVPITAGGSVVAVVTFYLQEARAVDERLVDPTTNVAADLGGLMRRLQAEAALREERGLKDRILETSPVGIAILDSDGTFRYINDRAATQLGVTDVEGPLTYADLDVEPRTFAGDPVADDGQPYRSVIEDGESIAGEARITVDGTERWFVVNGAPLADGDGAVTSAVFALQDVTRRKQRERQLQQRDAVLQTVTDGLYALDEDGRFVVVNDAYCELTGFDRAELLGRPAREVLDADLAAEAAALQAQILNDELEDATLEGTFTPAAGESVPIEARISLFELGDGDHGRAGVVRDVSDRKRREERLRQLTEVGQALMTAETRGEVASIVVEGARETLGLSQLTVEYYDEQAGRLRGGPRTDELDDRLGSETVFGGEWDLAWQAYAESDERVIADLDADPDVASEETPLGSAIVLPLGAHGVFVAGEAEPDAFTDTDVMLARILVANAIAALDRVDREQELKEKTARLAEHNESLERINRLNGVIRGLTRELTQATTREEVEAAVCTELADVDPYAFAWVGQQRVGGDEIVPRVSAGDDARYLEAVTVTTADATAAGPSATALETGAVAVEEHLQTDPPFEPWRRQAIQRGFRSCLAVPLTYRETVYGVLTVFADAPGVFDKTEAAVLDELGDMIGYAINAIERKKRLVSDAAVELTFRIDDDAIAPVRLASQADCTVSFETLVERGDGSLRTFFTLSDASAETVSAFADRTPGIESASLLTEREADCRWEMNLGEGSFLGTLLSYGAHPTGLTAEPSGCQVTVELPASGDVPSFVRTVRETYDGVDLLARRERDRPVKTNAEFEANYREQLTERQTEVLKTAYFSGFFEWPRETTGEELAAMLDVSQPTVSRHVRTGERKLFRLVFEAGPHGGDVGG